MAGFVAFIFMAAATAAIVAAAFLWVLAGILLEPSAWLGALDDSGAYDRAPAAIAQQLDQWVATRPASQPRSLGPLDATDVQAIVLALAPPDWLRSQAESVVPAVVSGIAATGEPRAVVSLEPLKARFTSGPLLAAVLDRIATWPACTLAQVQQLASGVLSRCQPPQASQSQLAVAAAGLLSVVAAELPQSVDLATPGPVPGSGSLTVAGIPDALRVASAGRSVVPSLVLVVLLLLGLASLLAGRTWRRWLRAWAFPALVAGLVLLAISVSVDPVVAAAINALKASLGAGGMAPSMLDIVGSAAASLVDRSGWLLLEIGGPLVAVALLALLAGLWPRRRAAAGG